MPVKTNASCVSIPNAQNSSGTMLLELNAGGQFFFECSFFETQENFNGVIRYQAVDNVGSNWQDISSLSGEGIFIKDTYISAIQDLVPSEGGSSYEFMPPEDFYVLWPPLVGLLVAGYIVKRLLAAF